MATNTMVAPVIAVGEVETTNRQEGSVSNRKTGNTARQIGRVDGGMALLCAGFAAEGNQNVPATMLDVVLETLAAVAVLTGVIGFTQAAASPAAAALETEGEQAMKVDTPPFPQRAALVDRLEEARDRAGGEEAARLALLWLRGVKWMLAGIPLAERGQPRYDWIEQHDELVVYSEPAGEWLIVPDVIWKIHDQHREAAVADDIAWLAVQNGLPGECEGYVPCDAQGMNTLDGEYLRRYPAGVHVPEIIQRVKDTLEQSLRLIAEPDGRQFLNPATDCGDLREPLIALRGAVARSSASADRDHALVLADRILQMCP